MNGVLPPLMLSSGLMDSLIQVSNELTSLDNNHFLQRRNTSAMKTRITLLSSLFQDIQHGMHNPVPPSSILCLTELYSVIRRAKTLIESLQEGSFIWNLMQTQHLSHQFYTLAKEMARALDILPLSLLGLTVDTKEQIELLHRQAKRVELFVDRVEVQKKDELLQLMLLNNEMHRTNKDSIYVRSRDILSSIGLRSPLEYEEEISKLEKEAEKQAGTGGLLVVANINNLILLISHSKPTIIRGDENHEDLKKRRLGQSLSQSIAVAIPDEFRCPISLDLMHDPVIVASGHTYDRNSIAQWINSGHHTCPKTGQRLIHMALIPNYALRSFMQQWCKENVVPTMESTSSSDQERSSTKRRSITIDHISATKAAADSVKLTAEFLVGILATGSVDIQRQAAYELRLLAKTGMDNRRIIAEAGAIPFLVTLLTSQDSRIQENAVTALLNLSIHDNNKTLIMAAGAIDSIVDVLQSGKTMEAKENAAAAIFSMSIRDEFKTIIGAHPRAITALVGLLGERTTAGKRDAATALFNLSLFNANRTKVIKAGAVPLLILLLTDDRAGITDDALAVLAILLGCSQGLEEMRTSPDLLPLLIDLLRFGSSKGKENSITLLLGLCKDGGHQVATILLMNPFSIPSLQKLTADGSLKARRKADALLRILNRCSSQITVHAQKCIYTCSFLLASNV